MFLPGVQHGRVESSTPAAALSRPPAGPYHREVPPTVLAVVPHPDDESYSVGGTLALAARAGWRCFVLCATRGRRGERHDGLPAEPATLGAAREAELRRSCLILGAELLDVWDYPDGELEAAGDEPQLRLAAALDALRPDIVLSLGPDGAYGHPDHLAVFRWVSEATRPRSTAVLFAAFPPGLFVPQYERCRAAGIMGAPPGISADDLGVRLADYEIGIAAVREQKLAAIAAHRTQLPGGDPAALFPAGVVDALLSVERFVDGRGGPRSTTARLLQSLTRPVPAEFA